MTEKNYWVLRPDEIKPLEKFETYAMAIRFRKLYFSVDLIVLHRLPNGKFIHPKSDNKGNQPFRLVMKVK